MKDEPGTVLLFILPPSSFILLKERHMISTTTSLIFLSCSIGFLVFMVLLAWIGRVPIKYNLRNIIVRWPINLLVAIAFTVVVGMLVFMLAFVNGMYRLTAGSGHPGNVIVLSDGALDEVFSNLGYRDVSKIELNNLVQTDDRGRKMASWELYMINNQPIPNAVKGGRHNRFLQLRGVDDPVTSGEVHGLTLYEDGKWFSAAGVEEVDKVNPAAIRDLTVAVAGDFADPMGTGPLVAGRRVFGSRTKQTLGQAVLGEGIARELGQDQKKATLKIGDTFDIGPKQWVVVGIMKSAGSTFDSEIWVKRDYAGPLFGKTGHSTCVLRTADAASAAQLATDLTTNYKESAIQATVETEYYEKLNTTNLQFLVTIAIVMFFMSIGGVVGVMIVMFAAISQRSKDIGILRIVGFRSWQVLVSFFLESLLLAVIGGVIGCAVGSLGNGYSATSMVGGGGGGGKSVVLKMSVDTSILMLGMLFALVMGCVGGLLPAIFAMRVRPLESLR